MTVPMSTLGENASITMGQSPPGSSYNRNGDGVPLLNGPTEFGAWNPVAAQWTSSPKKLCKAGDVLFCVRGATAGRLNTADKEYCLGRGLAAIRGKPGKFDTAFLRYVLANGYARFQSRGVGSTFINVSARELSSFPIPDLPLAAQKRIARILDAADALRAKRRESLAQLDTVLQSTFLDMFGDPVTNPMEWQTATGKDVFDDLTYGTSTKSLETPSPGCVPVLRIPNIIGGQINRSDLKFTKPTEKEAKKLALRGDDLLFVRTNGNPDYIGRCARYEAVPNETCLFASYLIRGRITPSVGVQAEYLKHHVEFPSYRHEVRREARTTAGNYNLSTSGIRKFKFIIPPIELQHRFAGIVESVQQQKVWQRAHLHELDTLFASLQSQAFLGDL